MWYGENNYGRTANSYIITIYTTGTPNEPVYTQLSHLQHIIAKYAQDLLRRRIKSYIDTSLEWK